MCNVAPGARCSGHTQKQLATKRAARARVQENLNTAVANANAAAASGRDASFRKYNKQANGYQARLEVLDNEIRHLQRDYDGTPKGRAELQAILDNPATSPADYNDAAARLNKGGALRALRTNLLEINQTARTRVVRRAIFGLDGGEFGEERVAGAAA